MAGGEGARDAAGAGGVGDSECAEDFERKTIGWVEGAARGGRPVEGRDEGSAFDYGVFGVGVERGAGGGAVENGRWKIEIGNWKRERLHSSIPKVLRDAKYALRSRME